MKTIYSGDDSEKALFIESVLREQNIEFEVEVSEDPESFIVSVADSDGPRAMASVENAQSAEIPEEFLTVAPPSKPAPAPPHSDSESPNRRVWLILCCVICPPLIPIAIGRALGGKVGVAVAAGVMAFLAGIAGIVTGNQGDNPTANTFFALAGVFAVLGPLEIFARRTPPTPSRS